MHSSYRLLFFFFFAKQKLRTLVHTIQRTHIIHADKHTICCDRNGLRRFVKRPLWRGKSWAGFWTQAEWGGPADWLWRLTLTFSESGTASPMATHILFVKQWSYSLLRQKKWLISERAVKWKSNPNNDIPIAANIHCRIKKSINKSGFPCAKLNSLSAPERRRSDMAVIWVGILVWISRLISWLFWPLSIGTSLSAFQFSRVLPAIPFTLCRGWLKSWNGPKKKDNICRGFLREPTETALVTAGGKLNISEEKTWENLSTLIVEAVRLLELWLKINRFFYRSSKQRSVILSLWTCIQSKGVCYYHSEHVFKAGLIVKENGFITPNMYSNQSSNRNANAFTDFTHACVYYC